ASPAAIATSAFVIASAAATLAIATTRRRRHERTVVGLERLNHQILGDATRRPEYHAETCEEVNESHAATLLALHELGRRVATHVSLETLLPTIVATTKSMTSCRHAAVYFWDGRDRTIRDGLSPRSRDVGAYVPDPSTGAAGWVIATQQTYTAAAADTSAELGKATAGDARRPAGIAPLIAGNELLGLLIADQSDGYAPISPTLLCNIANIAALGVRNVRLIEQLSDAARRDPLTGLIDRSAMASVIDDMTGTIPSTTAVGVVSGDVDHFDSILEQHGSETADTVLQELGRLWKAALPNGSVAFRMGRDAFLAVVPRIDVEQTREFAESLRESIASHPFTSTAAAQLAITSSFGVAEWRRLEQTFDEVSQDAEEAMKRSKASGGNRVLQAVAPLAHL
ncbi:MAG: sensor domain-containing diguanylate cyclase, partial [Planctomycetota bacterium]|nr:sensor domain-containing diguanylate cyclase [Planctomycetota bacterium]